MKKQIDWKFFVVLIATIAGVLVPVWLWRADLASRAMHFSVGSVVSLQPQGQATLDGLALTVDDVKLDSPFLTVLELHNDGSRPVPSTDFEGPIQILTIAPTKIVRARLTKSNPSDLPLKLKVEGGAISIQPLLLNPGDSFEIAVLTSGPAPVFKPVARIAGVRELPMMAESDVTPRSRYIKAAMSFLGAILSALPAGTLMWIGPSRSAILRPRVTILTFTVTGVTCTMLVLNALKQAGIEGFWPYAAASLALLSVAMPVGIWLNSPQSPENESS